MSESNVASGGSVTMTGPTTYAHTFTENGSLKVDRKVTARYLVVGGGGAPAYGVGGGGGGGEVKTGYIKLEPGSYTVKVGKSSDKLSSTASAVVRVDRQAPGTGYNGQRIQETIRETKGNLRPDAEPSSFGSIVAQGGKVGAPAYHYYTTGTVACYSDGNCYGPHTDLRERPTSGGASGNGNKGGGAKEFFDCRTYVNAPGGGGGAGGDAQETIINMSTTWCANAAGGTNPSQRYSFFLQGGPGIKSDISGQMKEYGAGQTVRWSGRRPSGYSTPEQGIVIISYDASTAETTPPPTTAAPTPPPVDIDALVKEYEAKMAQLRAAMNAEKQALLQQNAAAAQQAQQIQAQLTAELTSLKQRYDTLTAQVSQTETTLQTTQQQLVDLKNEYDAKIVALEAARKQEIDALNAQNAEAAAAAQAEQTRITSELNALKATYDALVKRAAECPVIPEGTVAVDGGDGQLYVFKSGTLRPMSMETYRAMGSPNYTTYPTGTLANCPRGPAMVVEASTTAPPVTTPSRDPVFPGTLYVIVHADSWLSTQQLKVLASRFGTLGVEPFQFKALEQVFVINNAGYIRNVAGDGLYLTNAGDCLSPVMSKDPPLAPWRISRTGDSPLEYTLVSSCGASLKASLGAQAAILEQGVFGSEVSENWYIVPVGRAQI